jgi:hypothetical protein
MGGYLILNYLFILAFFVGVSSLFLLISPNIGLDYLVFALMCISLRGNQDYNDFLKYTYSKADYYKIRIIENLVVSVPFAVFLIVTGNWLYALILLPLAALLMLVKVKTRWQFALPTPFAKHPFEVIAGFRVTFWVFGLAYFLTYISLHYANYGIGIFALILSCLTCMGFYFTVEEEFFVWIFSSKPRQFLAEKLKIALGSAFMLCLPILLALSIANPGKIPYILGFLLIGLGYVSAGVLCKYSTYPGEIGKKEGLLTMASVFVPPMLLGTIPYLYKKSLKSLEGILA